MPLSDYIPQGMGNAFMIIWLVILALVAAVIGWIIYTIVMKKKFNKKIVVFTKVGKTIEPVQKDTAMNMRLGDTGDMVFYTKRTKKYLPSPMIQTGRNIYWFYVREDGEWINFGVEDIDDKMRLMKAHYLDKEMRYARVALQKNFRDRYNKVTFLQKYGGLIAYTILIFITGIMLWLLFDKYLALTDKVNQTAEIGKMILEENRKLLSALDVYRSGGSGVVAAG